MTPITQSAIIFLFDAMAYPLEKAAHEAAVTSAALDFQA
jgi:hypothetical protein